MLYQVTVEARSTVYVLRYERLCDIFDCIRWNRASSDFGQLYLLDLNVVNTRRDLAAKIRRLWLKEKFQGYLRGSYTYSKVYRRVLRIHGVRINHMFIATNGSGGILEQPRECRADARIVHLRLLEARQVNSDSVLGTPSKPQALTDVHLLVYRFSNHDIPNADLDRKQF